MSSEIDKELNGVGDLNNSDCELIEVPVETVLISDEEGLEPDQARRCSLPWVFDRRPMRATAVAEFNLRDRNHQNDHLGPPGLDLRRTRDARPQGQDQGVLPRHLVTGPTF